MSRFRRKDKSYLCECSCGGYAKPGNRFIHNHHRKGKDKYVEEKAKTPPLCACRCGQPVKWNPIKKRWNKYLLRHSRRTKKFFIEQPSDSEAPLCACGYCNEKVTWNKQTKKWNKFIKAHEARGKNHPNWGKDKYAEEKAEGAPLCACGCEKRVNWNKGLKKWNKFLRGHCSRGKDKWAKEKAKGAPLCACGCGRQTKWCPTRNQYNKYIKGHHVGLDKDNSAYSPEALAKRAGKNHPSKKKPGYCKRLSDAIKALGENHPAKRSKFRERQSKYMSEGGAAHAASFIMNPSKPQVELYNLVKLIYSNVMLNYPSLNKSIDIAIPNKMIAIEYDGSYWHQDQKADNRRQRKLESIGWKFLRYRDYIPLIEELKEDLRKVNI